MTSNPIAGQRRRMVSSAIDPSGAPRARQRLPEQTDEKMDLKNIRESPSVVAKLKAGKRAEAWHNVCLKVGDLVIVSELYTTGPGYEAKVVSVFDEGITLRGKHLWRYGVEPTGRVKEHVAYIHAESRPCWSSACTN